MLYDRNFIKADAEREAARKRALVHFHRPANDTIACGLQAWPCKNSGTEAETTQGERINITTDTERVTCRECTRNLTDAEVSYLQGL